RGVAVPGVVGLPAGTEDADLDRVGPERRPSRHRPGDGERARLASRERLILKVLLVDVVLGGVVDLNVDHILAGRSARHVGGNRHRAARRNTARHGGGTRGEVRSWGWTRGWTRSADKRC